MADITTDPITAVEEQLWKLLEDSSDFTKRVQPGDRINYIDGRRDPEKHEVASADFPEVRLFPGGIVPHLQNTSSSSRLTAKFMLEVRTGTKVLLKAHNPLIWAVYKAMLPWAARLMALTIEENDSESFVVLAKPSGEIAENIERGEVSKGIEGWFAIWVIEVDMWFSTNNL